MSKFAVLLLFIALTACQHGTQNNAAVHQGIQDYLAAMGLNVQSMEVKLDSVQFNGSKADAAVSILLKGNKDPFMKKTYHLEEKAGKWVVIPSQEAAGHGMAPPPGAPNPHGGGAAAPEAVGKMPSPDDLPPARKK
jgi:hypothetical protein